MQTKETESGVIVIAYSPVGAALATGRSRSRIFKAIKNKELVARRTAGPPC